MTTSENIITNLSKIYIGDFEFTAEDGRIINYQRLVIEFTVKDQLQTLEIKLTPDKLQLLELADKPSSKTILDD